MRIACPKRIHFDGHRFRNSNRIGNLNFHAARKSVLDDLSRHKPAKVGGAPVNFRRVLSAKGTAAVMRGSAIGVGNDLSSRHTTIGGGPP